MDSTDGQLPQIARPGHAVQRLLNRPGNHFTIPDNSTQQDAAGRLTCATAANQLRCFERLLRSVRNLHAACGPNGYVRAGYVEGW